MKAVIMVPPTTLGTPGALGHLLFRGSGHTSLHGWAITGFGGGPGGGKLEGYLSLSWIEEHV